MQEVKYYAPEIDEFFIGFEYEEYQQKEWNKLISPPKSLGYEWAKKVFNTSTSLGKIKSKLEKIRVKYLDKEDIERLSFVFYDEFPVNYMEETCYAFHSKELNLMLGFYPKSSVISFATKDPSKNKIFSDTSVDPNRINMIKVKNISEFKKLLKGLDINGTN